MPLLSEIQFNVPVVLTVLLTLGVVLVNGWTDAPNSIASAVVTRALSPSAAVILAAVLNFCGVALTARVNLSVVETILGIASFGGDTALSQVALSAAMSAVVLWAVIAWKFGIPTSESHALIAGLSGASVSVLGDFSGLGKGEWSKVVFGLIFSSVFGFIFGWIFSKLIVVTFANSKRSKTNLLFDKLQIISAALSAFLHGAQDGQKFIGVFLLCLSLSKHESIIQVTKVPVSLMLLCSLTMAAGTALGGKRIIKAIAMDMVKIEKYQGFASDTASAVCVLISTVFGVPVSTTHSKSTALMGVAAAKSIRAVRWDNASRLVWAWVITFPACGIIAAVFAKVFPLIFK